MLDTSEDLTSALWPSLLLFASLSYRSGSGSGSAPFVEGVGEEAVEGVGEEAVAGAGELSSHPCRLHAARSTATRTQRAEGINFICREYEHLTNKKLSPR